MQHRYDNWVGGLNGDWLISRQRFFGIPFPVWYPLDGEGEPDYAHPLLPREDELPVDPSTDVPHGYTEDQRGKPNGFIGDPDVMDTWATSSLTPQIAGGWESDPDLFGRVFPMDLCTQAHDIIRTWLFSPGRARPLRAPRRCRGRTPLLSGWILDPDRKKMSKSKGNVVVPDRDPREVRRRRGPLAGRDGPPGPGLAVRRDPDEGRPPAGDEGAQRVEVRPRRRRRDLAQRLRGLRADRLRDARPAGRRGHARRPRPSRPTTTRPRWRRTERFFWEFCDDYLELVKERAYDEDGGAATASAQATLALALQVQLRLLAPFLPYVTEEVWSWWQEGSIHRAAWPTETDLGAAAAADATTLDAVSAALIGIRGAKSQAKVSMRAELSRVEISGPEALVRAAELAADDLRKTGKVTGDLVFTVDDSATELSVDAELAPTQ